MDEFLTEEFFLKLIRLGVALPEKRIEIRKILESLHEIREGTQVDVNTPPVEDPA